MHIVVASTSTLKIDAVHNAVQKCGMRANIRGVKACSGVNEQPLNEETKQGAKNRAENAQTIMPNADIYIAIENGLYEQGKDYFDKAIIYVITKDGRREFTYSEGVMVPAEIVKEVSESGFATTVGMAMKKKGMIEDAADPHIVLGDKKSRTTILEQALVELLSPLARIQKARLFGRGAEAGNEDISPS